MRESSVRRIRRGDDTVELVLREGGQCYTYSRHDLP